jgi:hypothetical protein
MSPPLLTGEHEQLSVDDKQLGDGVLESAAGLDSGADSVDPLGGNGFDVLLAVDHESECVERMSVPLGAMATSFSAPAMGEHQRSREGVWRDVEARQEPPLAAFQGSGLGSDRSTGNRHLMVIIQSDYHQNKPTPEVFVESEARPKRKAWIILCENCQ